MAERRTCVHEAGHALMAHVLDLPVAMVTVDPHGLTRLVSEPSPVDGMVFRSAGRVAEELVYGAAREESAVNDEVDALRDAFDVAQDLDLAFALMAEAREVVKDILKECRPDLERVADELGRSGRLSGADLELLIGPPPGERRCFRVGWRRLLPG
jgi:hypothetical protein